MAAAVVQTKGGSGIATTVAVVLNSNTTAGNLLIVQIYIASTAFATFSSITDSQSNTYAQIGTQATVNGNAVYRTYYARNIIGGTTTVTVTFSGSGQGNTVQVREYSGLDTSASVLDGVGSGTGNSTAASATATATTSATDLVVGAVASDIGSQTFTAGSGFANGSIQTSTNGAMYIEDKPSRLPARRLQTPRSALVGPGVCGQSPSDSRAVL
jgi:hypothetical protein